MKNNDSVVFLFAGWIVEKKGVLELFDVIEKNRDLDNFIFRFAGSRRCGNPKSTVPYGCA